MGLAKILGAALAAGTLAASVAGCGSDSGGKSTAASFGSCTVSGKAGEFKLNTITDDTLTIKADLPAAGWFDGDTVAKINSGYEYCMAADIAYRSGLHHIKLINTSFDQLVSGRMTGYDLSLNEISITPERQKVVTFSDPYYESTIGVLVKKNSDVTAANLRGKKIGVKQGTAAQQWVTDTLKPTGGVSVFPGDTEALAGVQAGRVDAYLQDTAIQLGQAKKSNGVVSVVGQYRSGQSYGAMFPKGSTNVATFNKILAQLKSDKTLEKLSQTYLGPAFGGDPAKVPSWNVS
ncbi:ABC transporter substrate-binding protein [Calidifontibacter terrae]